MVVSDLLFVDDASLLATGAERAQTPLKLLNDFCDATGMKVNNTKCEVLIFGGSPAERRGLAVNGFMLGNSRLDVVAEGKTAKYLGLFYGPGRPFTDCTKELLDSGRKAAYGLHSSHFQGA